MRLEITGAENPPSLNQGEETVPGTKAAFYFEFLDKAAHRFNADFGDEQDALLSCASCGAPTPVEICAFCKLVERATAVHP